MVYFIRNEEGKYYVYTRNGVHWTEDIYKATHFSQQIFAEQELEELSKYGINAEMAKFESETIYTEVEEES